jgi:hypothetical protein
MASMKRFPARLEAHLQHEGGDVDWAHPEWSPRLPSLGIPVLSARAEGAGSAR